MSRHGFFHSMVIVGGGLAVGCGGSTTGHSDDSSAAGGGDSIGQGGGQGGETASGGSAGISEGGRGAGPSASGGSAGGFTGPPTTGGTSQGGAAAMAAGAGGEPAQQPVVYDCPSEQIDCGDPFEFMFRVCDPGSDPHTLIPDDCACDDTRPTGPEDCPDGRILCMGATHDASGELLPEVKPFQCSCLPADAACQQSCTETFDGGDVTCRTENDADAVLCGCTLIVLR